MFLYQIHDHDQLLLNLIIIKIFERIRFLGCICDTRYTMLPYNAC